MTTYDAKLTKRDEVAEGTMAFHFDRPPGFSFKPGQAIDVVLINPPDADAQNGRHTFSLVSAPFEDDLVVASRFTTLPGHRRWLRRCGRR
jgi:ferredoxin-NADP reductase